jgi:hypothetical protein
MDTMSGVALNPPAIPADTSVDVWKMQIEGIRRQSISERLAIVESLNHRQRELEDRYLRSKFPHLNEGQLAVERVRHRYGSDLANEVAELLINRYRDQPSIRT